MLNTHARRSVTAAITLALATMLLGGVGAPAVAAEQTASGAATARPTPLRANVPLQVRSSRGAMLHDRKGRAVRNRAGQARRIARGTVRTYTHRVRIGGREYRRMARKGYLVRLSSLRSLPPRPVPKPRPLLVIQGDSITSQFNDRVGDPQRGWWSFLAQSKNARVLTDAVGGTGFAKRAAANGVGCVTPSFRERLGRVAAMRPDTLIVEGGRNDWWDCGVGALTPEQIDANVAAYFADLQKVVRSAGIDRVHVVTVWGTGDVVGRAPVVAAVQAHARLAGYPFTMIDLVQKETRDGTHPNAAGNQRIYRTLAPLVKVELGR
ncbi:SGNH/GDSL hydrolase family protein [Aeromicrobium sp. IC_218]|uniref:SGNH/GDSL hydrolase family protein n=1 Tax=Aeromicrobium sp. IC_218 TaxID=2545468 RepID=UPI00103F41ED|nr:SGNH/GDSL hydrolase family protein [Aeromicrobium sp. IC_218]TCI99417.1 SGNH/GDSL hydrolase family protein [Aeromicrobium sp. IC_218]